MDTNLCPWHSSHGHMILVYLEITLKNVTQIYTCYLYHDKIILKKIEKENKSNIIKPYNHKNIIPYIPLLHFY